MKPHLKTLIMAACITFVAAHCLAYQAGSYNIDGRRIDVRWEQTTRKEKATMNVYGEVYGGDACNQLNIEIYLANSVDGSRASRVVASIRNYPSAYRFQAQDIIYAGKGDGNAWVINNIYASCLN